MSVNRPWSSQATANDSKAPLLHFRSTACQYKAICVRACIFKPNRMKVFRCRKLREGRLMSTSKLQPSPVLNHRAARPDQPAADALERYKDDKLPCQLSTVAYSRCIHSIYTSFISAHCSRCLPSAIVAGKDGKPHGEYSRHQCAESF